MTRMYLLPKTSTFGLQSFSIHPDREDLSIDPHSQAKTDTVAIT